MTFVTIVIPCRNEERFIENCLDSIIAQDYPKDCLEVLVVDGTSTDKTYEVVDKYAKRHHFIRPLINPRGIVPTALNIGIMAARGDIIMRMDAHCTYGHDYISKCVYYLEAHSEVDNVGGICVTLPGNDTLVAQSIALGMSHPFGVGNSYFRIGTKRQRYVDTVPFGCYRRRVFSRIGLFDEDLVRTQDSEFNARLTKNGCRNLLVPEIVCYYYARPSLKSLWRMQFQYGYFKPLATKKIGTVLAMRHMVPPLFVGTIIFLSMASFVSAVFAELLLVTILVYGIVNVAVSLRIAVAKRLACLLVLPWVFLTMHFAWGLGCMKGIWMFLVVRRGTKGMVPDLPLTR